MKWQHCSSVALLTSWITFHLHGFSSICLLLHGYNHWLITWNLEGWDVNFLKHRNMHFQWLPRNSTTRDVQTGEKKSQLYYMCLEDNVVSFLNIYINKNIKRIQILFAYIEIIFSFSRYVLILLFLVFLAFFSCQQI